jgi:hypothetical protein
MAEITLPSMEHESCPTYLGLGRPKYRT